MSDASVDRLRTETADSVHANGLVITEELIQRRLGMKLTIIFPTFETDAAGIVSHGEELERLGKLCGYGNVIASLYFDNGELNLGIFVREGSIPQDAIDASCPPQARPIIELP